ncbi:MAG TPA: lipoyl synthase [Smithellaceae bacterium]|nr:lipoyl synthase [Smithellaceae bacterium]
MSPGKNPEMKTPSVQPYLRKPPWFKVPPPYARHSHHIRATLAGLNLHTVCQEACCPNIAECFADGTATFLIMGNICTRNCLYCNVMHGKPQPLDRQECDRLAKAVRDMNLNYVVITSVTRDDLPDGGAYFFAECIDRLRRENPEIKTEVLIPDFRGNAAALDKTIKAAPNVINHNMEVVRSLFGRLRPQGNYTLSLNILRHVSRRAVIAKSGFMVGLGETNDDILSLMDDLASTGCARLTIGQYQQPTRKHWPVARYYHPEEFAKLKEIAYQKGFQHVESGPLVRSSYHAAREV